ncbi:MAG: mRNA interferase [Nitrospirales bacterium]|nr:MAG: mRNA interferase [Nitrospirales bacterium]
MKRGDVWWVNFDPSLGGEFKKTRPAIIVSNNSSNKHMNRVQVVPITSKVGKLYPCEAYVTVQNKPTKAMADQVMTVSKERLLNRIEVLSHDTMIDVDHILKVQLGLH